MTIFSVPMVPILANTPGRKLGHDSIKDAIFSVFDGTGTPKITPKFPITTFPNMYVLTNLTPPSSIFEKFLPSEYPHFALYQEHIHSEIVVDDKDFHDIMPEYLDHNEQQKRDTVRLVIETYVFLMKIRGFHNFHTPIMLEGSSVRDLQKAKEKSVTIHALYHRPMAVPMSSTMATFGNSSLTLEDLQWVFENHHRLYDMFYEAQNFTPVANVLRNLSTDVEVETLMAILWAGIEFIVKPPSPIRQSISRRISVILHDMRVLPGATMLDISQEIMNFYDYRCDVVHGNRPMISDWNSMRNGHINNDDFRGLDALQGTFNVFRLLFIGVIERGGFFSKEELIELEKKFHES